MSTKDETLSAELHGEALLTAQRPELQPLIDHLREVAQGRDDIRTECAGTIAGSWFACPVCGKNDGHINIGRGHWFYCIQHKKRQYVGSNLFSAWRDETEDEQRAHMKS